jgi:hypothetical protein
MKITVWLIPTRQRFDNCLLKKFNYRYLSGVFKFHLKVGVEESIVNALHGSAVSILGFYRSGAFTVDS